jgi:hypothetical protein
MKLEATKAANQSMLATNLRDAERFGNAVMDKPST